MRGFTWTVVIWGVTLVIVARRSSWLKLKLEREHLAVILLLLSTHSLSSASADEILADPVTIERALRGVLVGLALLVVLPALLRRFRQGAIPAGRALLSFGLYAAVAAASTLYSAAQLVTTGKVFELGVAVLVAAALVMREDASQALRTAIRLVVALEAALIAVAIAGYFAIPGTFQLVGGRPGFLAGPTMKSPFAHFNHLSAAGAMSFAFALSGVFTARERSARLGWSTMAVIGTVGMLLAAGRQGLVIWLASAAVVLFFHRRRLFLALIAPLTAIVAVVNWDALLELFQRGQSESTFSSLSGRLVWWSAAIDAWKVHPWTGYGFGTGGRFVALHDIGVSSSSLHSGYFEALVGVGLLGVIPMFLAIVLVTRWALRSLRSGSYPMEAILIVPLLLHTSISLGFGAWLVADVLLFIFLAGLTDLESLQPKKTDSATGMSLLGPAFEFR